MDDGQKGRERTDDRVERKEQASLIKGLCCSNSRLLVGRSD